MDNKPNVFPQKNNISKADMLKQFNEERLEVVGDIYSAPEDVSDGYAQAMAQMANRTMPQIDDLRPEDADKVLFGKTTPSYESEIELRDKQLAYNVEQTRKYHELAEEAKNRPRVEAYVEPKKERKVFQSPGISTREGIEHFHYPQETVSKETEHQRYVRELSQPNFNCAFDVIPLPSKGKLYKNKRPNIRIGYMTTADENILTSPNLIQSGEFLEILFNRKILESDLRYADLHVGDRNALMLWLRATAYGEMYPFTILDNEGNPFECEINLNNLPTKELGAEPDENGYFDFQLPLTKTNIKVRLLTCGDIEELEKVLALEKERGVPINNSSTYTLIKSIVSVEGDTNKTNIREFVDSMRVQDSKQLNKFISEIESGVDLNINVKAPGGESIATFLPLNVNFFWPDFGI